MGEGRSKRRRKPGWSTGAQEIVDRLFVYGTLRSGHTARSLIAEHVSTSEPATMLGSIYSFPGGYPGFVAQGDTTIVGEVVTLRDLHAAFPLLDAYEGDDFARALRQAKLADGSDVWVWVYALSNDALIADGELVPSGDWSSLLD